MSLLLKFKIRVWYRYVVGENQEKQFEDFFIESIGVHCAYKSIEKKHFENLSRIPFQYGQVIQGRVYQWYKPYGCYKSEYFYKPLSELNKQY